MSDVSSSSDVIKEDGQKDNLNGVNIVRNYSMPFDFSPLMFPAPLPPPPAHSGGYFPMNLNLYSNLLPYAPGLRHTNPGSPTITLGHQQAQLSNHNLSTTSIYRGAFPSSPNLSPALFEFPRFPFPYLTSPLISAHPRANLHQNPDSQTQPQLSTLSVQSGRGRGRGRKKSLPKKLSLQPQLSTLSSHAQPQSTTPDSTHDNPLSPLQNLSLKSPIKKCANKKPMNGFTLFQKETYEKMISQCTSDAEKNAIRMDGKEKWHLLSAQEQADYHERAKSQSVKDDNKTKKKRAIITENADPHKKGQLCRCGLCKHDEEECIKEIAE